MSRDDSLLYTGVTSVSKPKETPRQIQAEENEQKHRKLKLASEVVFPELEKERVAIASLMGTLIHTEMSEQDIKATVLGLRIADQRVVALTTRLKNIMNVKEAKK